MKRQGISQDSLARDIGKTQDFISRRLTCKVAFTVEELEAFAAALSVPVVDLMGDEAVAS
jgi:transcriptional regulator with XRE-family HTH domain